MIAEAPWGTKMNEEQFWEWLKHADADGDGRVSKQELREALRALGLRHNRWKAWRAMAHADINGNRRIDGDNEGQKLMEYARNRWGIILVEE